MNINILKLIGDYLKWFSNSVPKSCKALVLVLVVLNITMGYYIYSLQSENIVLNEKLLKTEQEKNQIITKLKDDFLVYLKDMIQYQKSANSELDTLIQKKNKYQK